MKNNHKAHSKDYNPYSQHSKSSFFEEYIYKYMYIVMQQMKKSMWLVGSQSAIPLGLENFFADCKTSLEIWK